MEEARLPRRKQDTVTRKRDKLRCPLASLHKRKEVSHSFLQRLINNSLLDL
jgi:hypothetical protein